MKVTFVNYYYDKDIPIDKYLDKYPAVYGWCKSLSDLGISVKVYHRFAENFFFKNNNVEFNLIKDDLRNDLKWYQFPLEFHKKIIEDKHDIIHVNSFVYSYQASLLKKKIPSVKFVIQHHAEKSGHWIKQILLRKFSNSMDGFIFSSKGIYDEWVKATAIYPEKKFAEIMEGSSNFTHQDRNQIRSKTGLTGKPVFLWVGRLNENKDPLTVLSGFSKLVNDFPDAKLYMIFSEANLNKKVLTFIEQNSNLKDSVKLMGFIEHQDICDYYNSADYFVLGSHYEGSGFSLVEAMSCGVIPIVTDIPSFRMMTDNGKIGTLWRCGDAESFYNHSKTILEKTMEAESKKVIEQFQTNLSYAVIGMKTKLFYESLITY